MFGILTMLFLTIFAVGFFIWGFKLRQGKWLKTLAGNNFGELPLDKAKKLGRSSGFILYLSGLFCLLIGIAIISNNKFYHNIMLVLIGGVSLLSLWLIVSSLSDWLKNG